MLYIAIYIEYTALTHFQLPEAGQELLAFLAERTQNDAVALSAALLRPLSTLYRK